MADATVREPVVSVVIPFFQEQPGILAETVGAIISHSRDHACEIVVVDDGSPTPARDELAELVDEGAPVRVVEQDNAGPGAARNKGLDSVAPSSRYVALVDSDDRWVADFIGDGLAAMEHGFDLFIGNSQRVDIDGTRFDWQAEAGLSLKPDEHDAVDQERRIYGFRGDFFDFMVYRSNIVGPSTMMYRLACAPDLRFSETIFNGQDRLFKLHLARHLGRVAFSPQVYAREGRGVNIFDSAGWGSPKSLRFLSSYIDLCKTILAEVPLGPEQRRHVRGQLASVRASFPLSLVHLLRRRQPVDRAVVWKTFRRDPSTLLLLGPNLARAALKKLGA